MTMVTTESHSHQNGTYIANDSMELGQTQVDLFCKGGLYILTIIMDFHHLIQTCLCVFHVILSFTFLVNLLVWGHKIIPINFQTLLFYFLFREFMCERLAVCLCGVYKIMNSLFTS